MVSAAIYLNFKSYVNQLLFRLFDFSQSPWMVKLLPILAAVVPTASNGLPTLVLLYR